MGAKKFVAKSRVYCPLPSPSPMTAKRERETKELLEFLERLKRKWFFLRKS